MKFTRSSERGQAIVLIALGMVGLVAIMGLAIDGGFAFSDRRSAQNAADASALAAALAKVNSLEASPGNFSAADTSATLTALDIAYEHGFTDDLVTNDVRVEIPPISGPYAGDSEYLQIFIETHRNTFFARVIGIDQTHSTVEAIARAKEPINEALFGGNAIVSLNPTSDRCSFDFGGNSNTIIDGGIFVNGADPDCAFDQSGCTSNLDSTSGSSVPITIVGGYGENKTCPEVINGDVTTGADQLPWPDSIYHLPEPSECGQTPTSASYDKDADETTFYPGYYSGKFPPNEKGDYVLESGIYCVDEIKITTGKVTGTDVFFYITEGGAFDISGGINNLAAKTIDDPADPDFAYSNYLIYAAPDLDSSKPAGCTMNGNEDSSIWGTVYAPYCDITINGSTGTTDGFHSQMVGYDVKLNGNGDLWFIYNPDENGGQIEPAEVGLSQ